VACLRVSVRQSNGLRQRVIAPYQCSLSTTLNPPQSYQSSIEGKDGAKQAKPTTRFAPIPTTSPKMESQIAASSFQTRARGAEQQIYSEHVTITKKYCNEKAIYYVVMERKQDSIGGMGSID